MLDTKFDLSHDHAIMREGFLKHANKLENTESKLERTITDTKYWLDNYAASYRESDKTMNSVRVDCIGRLEAVEFALSRRVSVDDLRAN